jgi:hypothetical protein
MANSGPRVFISYSHDSEQHRGWVLQLASDLRTNGIDALLDQWDLSAGEDVSMFMQHGISDSDRVLLVCSDQYVSKAEAGSGGVGFERLIVTAELVANIDTKKFIPLLRDNDSKKLVPKFLGPRLFVDFRDDASYAATLDELLRELHGVSSSGKPPLGVNPFSGTPPSPPPRQIGASGLTGAGTSLLDDEWFVTQGSAAMEGLLSKVLAGFMELRFALHAPLRKSQIELLDGVRAAQINTFGWPIAVLLEPREEYRPRPLAEGIRAEIAIEPDEWSNRSSYDCWALRTTGDFYLLQSLFEDSRSEGKLFFNTRIVRIAESFLFAQGLYMHLGAPDDAKVSARVVHGGLASRELTSSTPNRMIRPRSAVEDRSEVEVVSTVADLGGRVVDHVQQVAGPLFMLFDFASISNEVVTNIVERFQRGDVS